ncbi:MAG: hypothetical protein AB1505_26655 [Candidatus Latescibacterota bacterium]
MSVRWVGLLLGIGLLAPALEAQDYGARLGTVQRGGRVTFEPTGPGVLFDALDPVVRKWYVPQELYAEYQWKQWQYTNYAREPYQRYVSTSLEGIYFYDVYGQYLTRGWMIYDWRQTSPQPFGSALEKSGSYGGWFHSLVVAADHRGQYHYAITVGDQIRTTLTPMTFSQVNFNGIQWDFASDRWEITALLSRISQPSPTTVRDEDYTNATNLFGGRIVAQIGDFVKVGGTFLNAHHAQTQLEPFQGNIFQGHLTEVQNFDAVTAFEVRIGDDSPQDQEGGGALFSSDILLTDLEGNQIRGSEIGFRPVIEGGFQRRGYLAADGAEAMTVRYDLLSSDYSGPDPTEITRAQVELVLANDYDVGVSSSVQAGAFLPVARARGNVRDGSNQRVLVVDYGLPTATQVAGYTAEVIDVAGLKGYFELDTSTRYRQYPNPNLRRHHTASERALAWLATLSRTAYPFFAYGEAFSVEPEYATNIVVAGGDGTVSYLREMDTFEFVDDNDDQDRTPDWVRKTSVGGDSEVFPGLDENNDWIQDFNQNTNPTSPNLIPDYEEPFLRFYTDRPEFLYGVDMNHNGTIDRFENDELADLPYGRDRQGFNVYGGTHLAPWARATFGHARLRQLSDRRRSHAWYGLLTADREWQGTTRLRLFQDTRRVRDTIRDDLLQWVQLPNTLGDNRLTVDPLPAQDTWISTTWVGLEHPFVLPGLRLVHKLKWQLYHQLDGPRQVELRGLREASSFLGLINKTEYSLHLGSLSLSPRWKSELRRESPLLRSQSRRLELTELAMLIGRLPVLHSSFLEAGVEQEWFRQLRDPVPPGAEATFSGLTTTVQLTNQSDYQGYRLTTTAGFEAARLDLEYEPVQVRTRYFISLYAGVQR